MYVSSLALLVYLVLPFKSQVTKDNKNVLQKLFVTCLGLQQSTICECLVTLSIPNHVLVMVLEIGFIKGKFLFIKKILKW